jgi:hypothetical protein
VNALTIGDIFTIVSLCSLVNVAAWIVTLSVVLMVRG